MHDSGSPYAGRTPCWGRTDVMVPPLGLSSWEMQRANDAAKQLCKACDHVEACRDYADRIETERGISSSKTSVMGVYGGESASERLRRRRNARRAELRAARKAKYERQKNSLASACLPARSG